jgi:hypothetical protein
VRLQWEEEDVIGIPGKVEEALVVAHVSLFVGMEAIQHQLAVLY